MVRGHSPGFCARWISAQTQIERRSWGKGARITVGLKPATNGLTISAGRLYHRRRSSVRLTEQPSLSGFSARLQQFQRGMPFVLPVLIRDFAASIKVEYPELSTSFAIELAWKAHKAIERSVFVSDELRQYPKSEAVLAALKAQGESQ